MPLKKINSLVTTNEIYMHPGVCIDMLPASVENDTTTRKRTTKTGKVNHFDR
jgi:hypothetical protein